MVRPSEPTPSDPLPLSAIDKALRVIDYKILCVFRYGNEKSIEMIKEAFAKVLVPYYPLAGRLQKSSDDDDDGPGDDLHVSCTGEGVWFVEASANCSLVAANYFDDDPTVEAVHDKLMPNPTPEAMGLAPILLIQVTSFKCGGFVVGVIVNHALCDGIGVAQVLNAVKELVIGLKRPSVEPVWFRESILPSHSVVNRKPKPPSPSPPPLVPHYQQLQCAKFDVPGHVIDHLKNEFSHLTGNKTCTTFEVISAILWRSRTRAINLPDSATVKLLFYANIRHLLNPPVPQGFYGNCIFPVTVTCLSGWLKETSTGEVIKLIMETKASLPFKLNKWIYNKAGGDGHDDEDIAAEEPIFIAPPDYATLCLSGIDKFSKGSKDLEWGHLFHAFPVGLSQAHIVPLAFLCSPPAPKTGICLKAWCVEDSHLPSLHDELKNFLTNFNGST
ncbi:hypothetical protein Sjap_007641 [Stephania japonica]|uniref:Uncharacterized protein n=1 Tax=Stephania japonica TaxID=461633 RepID=A0AAP0PAL7_9MAGN